MTTNGTLKFLGRDTGFGLKNNSAYYEDAKRFVLIDCGITVYPIVLEKIDFTKYETIDIFITHLHPDHAGSLGQLLMYLGYKLNKKANVISCCKNIKIFLDIIGVDPELYTLNISNVSFIKTTHAPELDSYGFKIKLSDKWIVYTGDTSTLEPFEKYLSDADELYVDVSRAGGVHLKIDDVIEKKLVSIQNTGVKVYLMHLDDEEYISNIVNHKIEFAQF